MASARSVLFGLPSEIRATIYGLVFCGNIHPNVVLVRALEVFQGSSLRWTGHRSVLLVNKATYHDAIDTFWKFCRVMMTSDDPQIVRKTYSKPSKLWQKARLMEIELPKTGEDWLNILKPMKLKELTINMDRASLDPEPMELTQEELADFVSARRRTAGPLERYIFNVLGNSEAFQVMKESRQVLSPDGVMKFVFLIEMPIPVPGVSPFRDCIVTWGGDNKFKLDLMTIEERPELTSKA